MSPAVVEEQNLRHRFRRAVPQSLTFHWDKPCRYGCGFIHLNVASKGDLQNCCYGGKALAQDSWPSLSHLPSYWVQLFQEELPHFSRSSSIYNNILALASTGVDNERGGGFERNMHGDHAVKLQGRTYHTFPRAQAGSDMTGGLSYFIFDDVDAMINHVERINEGTAARQYNSNEEQAADRGELQRSNRYIETVRHDIIQRLKADLQVINPFARDLLHMGRVFKDRDGGLHIYGTLTNSEMMAEINNVTNYFEVAHITSNHPGGNKAFFIYFKKSNNMGIAEEVDNDNIDREMYVQKIGLFDRRVEPLSYPLLFPHGELGWGRGEYAVQIQDVDFKPYLCSLMLRPENIINDDGVSVPFLLKAVIQNDDDNGQRMIHCNRFQAASRLGQVSYIISFISYHNNTKLLLLFSLL
jgi:hypothetical protein